MQYYEGYLHTNGNIMVVPVPKWAEAIVDQHGPFVKKYYGKIKLSSKNEAEKYFNHKYGNKSSGITKGLLKNYYCAVCYSFEGKKHRQDHWHEIFGSSDRQFCIDNHFQIPICMEQHEAMRNNANCWVMLLTILCPGYDAQAIIRDFKNRLVDDEAEQRLIKIGKQINFSKWEIKK